MLHPRMSVQRIYLKINRHSFSNVLQLNLAGWLKYLKKEVGTNYAPWNNDLYDDFYLFAIFVCEIFIKVREVSNKTR